MRGYLPSGSVAGVIDDRPSCAELDRAHPRRGRTNPEGALAAPAPGLSRAEEPGGPMAIRTEESDGVAEVIIDNPPVNALSSAGWFELADTVKREGSRSDVHCLVIRAEGRGFQAGVDIKELAADGTPDRRRQPRLLRHLRRHLRLPGAGDLRRARLLPRRRHRHRGLVRLRDRVGRRDLRPARRSTAARSAPPPT